MRKVLVNPKTSLSEVSTVEWRRERETESGCWMKMYHEIGATNVVSLHVHQISLVPGGQVWYKCHDSTFRFVFLRETEKFVTFAFFDCQLQLNKRQCSILSLFKNYIPRNDVLQMCTTVIQVHHLLPLIIFLSLPASLCSSSNLSMLCST